MPGLTAAAHPGGDVEIMELPSSWLSAEPIECLRNACRLTAKKYGLELYDLNDEELPAFMQEGQVCARALCKRPKAVK